MAQITSNLLHWKNVLKQLTDEELPKAKERMGKAAADGDLNENAEYEDAERQLEFVEARIAEIKKLIKTLEQNALLQNSAGTGAVKVK